MMGKILLTGYTGFLGKHILEFLKKEKYSVIKVGRNKSSDIQRDISSDYFSEVEVDYVIHVAGKAHTVPKTKEEINEFYKVNVKGTQNLLKSLSLKKLKAIVFISTVAVYGKETGELINESYPLLGNTPYALSKIKAEKEILSFGKKHNINVIILRLPLITGKNPVGNLKEIVETIQKGYYFRIGKGKAKRSIVSASDVANVMPELMRLNGVYNFTDCNHPMIFEIDEIIAKKYNKKVKKLPIVFLKWISKIGDIIPFFPFNSSKFDKLTNTLTFSNEKILNHIKFRPVNGLSDII